MLANTHGNKISADSREEGYTLRCDKVAREWVKFVLVLATENSLMGLI